MSWQWIFWVNVPIGLLTIPLAAALLVESRGPDARLDVPGLALASSGLLALVWALINGNADGWTSAPIVVALAAAAALLAGFVAWERRTASPMLPPRFFRSRQFSAANGVSFLMSFGMFGSIFLLAQFFQVVQGYSPFEAGLRTLPWTGMPIIVAPIAGALSDRIHPRLILVTGMGLMGAGLAWMAAVVSPTVDYATLVPAFVVAGTGMALFFAPTANLVLSAVRREEEGRASGANNTIREVGGVFGVAVLASVFSAFGGFASPQSFVDGLAPALWVGASLVAAGALAALLIPSRRSTGIAESLGLDGSLGMGTLAPDRVRIDR